jgi:SAM-dependent methyltransferase
VLEFDERAAQNIEALYATPEVVEQRQLVREAIGLRQGEQVLDLGCGPGYLAVEMAAEIGPDGRVHAVDGSESMLASARRRECGPDAAPIEFQLADVTALPFADGSFDVAISSQVYEYVEDVAAALDEAHRVLKPGGRLFVLDTDWDSIVLHAPEPGLTRRILEAWDEHLADPRLPRRLPGLLRRSGFELFECRTIPMLNVGYDRTTYAAGVLEVLAAFVVGRNGLTEDEVQAWRAAQAALGDEWFFSLNRYLFGGRTPT